MLQFIFILLKRKQPHSDQTIHGKNLKMLFFLMRSFCKAAKFRNVEKLYYIGVILIIKDILNLIILTKNLNQCF